MPYVFLAILQHKIHIKLNKCEIYCLPAWFAAVFLSVLYAVWVKTLLLIEQIGLGRSLKALFNQKGV